MSCRVPFHAIIARRCSEDALTVGGAAVYAVAQPGCAFTDARRTRVSGGRARDPMNAVGEAPSAVDSPGLSAIGVAHDARPAAAAVVNHVTGWVRALGVHNTKGRERNSRADGDHPPP